MNRRLDSILILLLLMPAIALGEDAGSDQGQDRRCRYGDGSAPGCNNKEDSAAYQGDQKSKQQLTPPMMQHFQQAMQHQQKAEEARQQQDEGTAQKEDMLSKMEQMKGEQLKQQIDENKKSADQNRQSEAMVSKEPDDGGKNAINKATQSITVDKDRQAAKDAAAQSGSATPPSTSQAPPEIAKFDDFERPSRPAPADKAEAKVPDKAPPPADPPAEPKSASWQVDLASVAGAKDRAAIGFNDNAKPTGGGATSGSPDAATRLISSASAEGTMTIDGVTTKAPDGSATAQANATNTVAADGTAGSSITAPKPADTAKTPTILALRNGTRPKGKEGEGDDFWKKLDKANRDSKRATAARTRGRGAAKTGKGVVSARNVASE